MRYTAVACGCGRFHASTGLYISGCNVAGSGLKYRVGMFYVFQNLECVVVGGRLYINSIARARRSGNAYIKGGGVGFVKRKTAFSGLFEHVLLLHIPFCPWVGGAVLSVAVVSA